MQKYRLYIWKPRRWKWVDQGSAIYHINNGQPYNLYWSCGRVKTITVGDFFFLMRLGNDPKGIIGFGSVLSTPYSDKHWDPYQAARNKDANYTDMHFQFLSEKPILSLEYLQNQYSQVRWTPQSSGNSIPSEVAELVISDIDRKSQPPITFPTADEIKKYAEGRVRTITIQTYDRSSEARRQAIIAHGYNCSVCGFDFKRCYGDWGNAYIEVHHLEPLASIKGEHEINPAQDLRPVCANCHRMLHRSNPPLSIEKLKDIVVKQQNLFASQ